MASKKRNRLQYLLLRRKLKFVNQGVKILTDKRDALMKEFHGMIPAVHSARKRLVDLMDRAVRTLRIAKGMEPHEGLVSSAVAARRTVNFPVAVKKVWGVRMPETDFVYEKRGLYERGSLPGSRHPAVDRTAEEFEEVIGALMRSAFLESRLKGTGAAVRSTGRRVNALEKVVRPDVEKDIEQIREYLEEMFREEVFRMKRYKTLQERRANAEDDNG